MIPTPQAHVQVAAGTHPGLRGKQNEDRYGVSAYILNEHQPVPSVLAIVTDGIGGHRAGEIAAEMAVENISRIVAESDASQPVEILRQAFSAASQAIYQKAASDPSLQGMGTTCVCCWIISNRLYIASVGDSRIYLARDGTIHQLSIDHTWVQEAIELGTITPDQAKNHPNTHVIRRFLGARDQHSPDLRLRMNPAENNARAEANQGLLLHPGNQVMLCSDGLTDLVNADEIHAILQQHPGQAAIDRLIELSNSRGGHDNITIVLLQVPEKTLQKTSPSRRNILLACSSAVLLLVLIALLVAGDWFSDRIRRSSRPPKSTASQAITLTVEPALPLLVPTKQIFPTATRPPVWRTPDNSLLPGGMIQTSPATLTPWPTNTP